MPGICPICGENNGRNKKACSHECYAKLRQNIKVCAICGNEFADAKSNKSICCSKECSVRHRKNLASNGVYDESLLKAQSCIATSPLTGKFETHMHAKKWVIQSPCGEVYECRNLKNWLRDHEELIDGTVSQAWDGITKIKYSMQGKRKNISHQWKGWRLIEWGE